jgi:hypothetical protein
MMMMNHKNGFRGKHWGKGKHDWMMFNEDKNGLLSSLTPEQKVALGNIYGKGGKKDAKFGKRDSRHLQSMRGETEGRRLRSAFDVFDFVSNAIDSGVKKAKHSQNKALREFTEEVEKIAKPIVEDVKEMAKKDDVKKVVDEVKAEVNTFVEDVEKEVKKQEDKQQPKTETVAEDIVVPAAEHVLQASAEQTSEETTKAFVEEPVE